MKNDEGDFHYIVPSIGLLAIIFLIFVQEDALTETRRPDFSHLKDLQNVSEINRVILDNIPNATRQEISKWNNLTSCPSDPNQSALSNLGQCGIAGNDFFGIKQIELSPGESKCAIDTFNEWYPIPYSGTPGFGAKRTACGLLKEYSQTGTDWHRAWNVGDVGDCFDNPLGIVHPWLSADYNCWEDTVSDAVHDHLFCDHDYDLDIELFPVFHSLVNSASNLSEDWQCTSTPVKCKVHAEIDLPFDVNPSAFSVPVAGFGGGYLKKFAEAHQNICVFGPWVIDDNRLAKREWIPSNELLGRKVEIHPAEQIWYGNRKGALLLSTADYSSRYARQDDFDRSGNALKMVPFVPWAATPLQSRFAVAFKIEPDAPLIWYRLQTVAADNIKRFSSDGQEHELAIRESGEIRPLVYVIEQPNGDLADINFEEVRRLPDGSIQGYIQIRAIVGLDPHAIEGGGTGGGDVRPPGGVLPRVVPVASPSYTEGGHIEYWLFEGQPADHKIQIHSIKRLASNNYTLSVGDQNVTVPVSRIPIGYDENFVRLLLESTSPTLQFETIVRVDHVVNFSDVVVTVHQPPFEARAFLNFKAQDAFGNSLGVATAFISTADYGGTKTIQIKSYYPDINEWNPPEPDPANPPGPEDTNRMLRPAPGVTEAVREVTRFEITYTVNSGNPRSPGHLPIPRN